MARRNFDIFSMSFLDAICCGFGSIVLLYMLITAQGKKYDAHLTEDLRAEAILVEQQVLEGRRNLAELRNSMQDTEKRKVTAEGLSTRVLTELEQKKQELAAAENDTLASRERLERLKSDLKALEEGARRLEAGAKATRPGGASVTGFKGDGDRLYLTGIRVRGQRVLFLVDASASMLDDTLVNVLRMRNMTDDRKLRSEKWRRTVAAVDWMTSQLQPGGQFQLYTFNTQPAALVDGSAGKWLPVDAKTVSQALDRLGRTVPRDGTSLENAFAVVRSLVPAPDNIILITDGLPTQGTSPPAFKKLVDGDDRLKLFQHAVGALPKRVPVSTILMPMEGDPSAPGAFWALAKGTGGAFMSPARDWP
jgi:hypothetical protein